MKTSIADIAHFTQTWVHTYIHTHTNIHSHKRAHTHIPTELEIQN